MTKTRPSVTGQGPELFGRGIDLLFGEADEIPLALPADLDEPRSASAEQRADQRLGPAWRGSWRRDPIGRGWGLPSAGGS